jgi:hypothetical protein
MSLLTLVLFIFAVSFMFTLNKAQADDHEDDIVVGESVGEETRGDHGNGDEEDAERSADVYQHDTSTSPYGETFQRWSFSPDIGYGEVGEGYSYTNPMTGETVSYQVTGMGMGAIPLPIYGGMGSQYGQASYGIFASGGVPVVQSTPGMHTQTSAAGSAFGDGYQYAASQPDPTAMVAMSLIQNPSTAGLGYAMAFSSGALGGFSLPTTIGGTSGIGGLSGGFGSFGGLGASRLGISSGFGGLGSIGGLGISAGLGGLGYSGAGYGLNPGYSAYSGGYAPAPYYGGGYAPAPSYGGGYAPAPYYGGGYTAPPASSAYAPPYGYQPAPSSANPQTTQGQYVPQYTY